LPYEDAGELLQDLGVAPERVLLHPPLGHATERDLLRRNARVSPLCELVHGILVEKGTDSIDAFLATRLGCLLANYAEELGVVVGSDAPYRIGPGLVRLPDVSYVAWDRFPGRMLPRDPICKLAPDLAAEVLSPRNKRREIERKLQEYFLAGVRLVWVVDPTKRTAQVYTAPDQSVVLTEGQTLDGGDVLPGFRLPLQKLFARVPTTGGRPKPLRRKGGAA
jgi:Uma2 family endonuclease